MKSRLLLLLVAICIVAPAVAEPYWIAWEGDDFPENQGWERHWGNWDGPYEGDGAIRTLNDGVMTYDSRQDDGIFDGSIMSRPGELDPEPGEMFVMEWRLNVRELVGSYDSSVALASDQSRILGFECAYDEIRSGYDESMTVPITPEVFHVYRVETSDMEDYAFYVDGTLVHEGTLIQSGGLQSRIAWGDGVQGAASLHDWDYFRFGVVPEPSQLLALLILCALGARTYRSGRAL